MALALALLVVGGIALFGALTSKQSGPVSPTPTPSRTAAATAGGSGTGDAAPSTAAVQAPTLKIRVVGAPTKVYVAVPGTSSATVLQNGVLNTGEIRTYGDQRLVVVVYNAAAVEVSLNGKLQARGAAGARQQWTVERSGQ